MSQPVFRLMRQEDIEAIVELENNSFATPWSRAAFEEELANDLAYYLIMEAAGQIIGYAGMWIILDEAHVMNVAVAPAWRSRGFGRQLMRALIRLANTKGAERMTLEVRVSNTVARRLYEQLGFVPCGIRPQYYTDSGEDALLLWRDGLST